MAKVLYVITKSNWGGAQKYVYNLALAAKERGWEAVVVAGGSGELITRLNESGIRTISLPKVKRDIQFLGEVSTLFKLIKIFREEKPDVIHLNSPKAGGLGSVAGRLTGVKKIIFTGHGWAFNESRPLWQKPLIYFFQWLMIVFSHQTIAVSRQTANQLDVLPFIKNKIKVIYNGLATPHFLTKIEARTKLDSSNQDGIWLGTIAELHKNKGLDILILAFKKVLEKIGGLTLIIIGEGEERENLARLIARYQLVNNVKLVGRHNEAASLLPAFDLFILPSRTEALPYVVLEAGLAGLPVIASRVGGIPEIIENNKEGALVEPNNTHLLADKILDLLANQKLQEGYGKNLQQKILTHFSPAQMLDQTFTLYKK